jgi:hypothetical protein
LYRAGSLETVLREVLKYKLDLVGAREIRWDGDGTEPAGEYTLLYRKGNKNHELGESYQQLRVEFVRDRMSYIILRGRRCHIIVQNVHAPTDAITADVKNSFYEELEHVYDKFPK